MFFRPGTTRLPLGMHDRARKTGRRLQRLELNPATDAHARAAVEAYADSCAREMPWLAELLRASAPHEHGETTHCAATAARVFALAQAWAAEQPDYAHAAWEHVRKQFDAALHARPQTDQPDAASEPDAGNASGPSAQAGDEPGPAASTAPHD